MGVNLSNLIRIDPDSPIRTCATMEGTLQDFYRASPSVGIDVGYFKGVSGEHKFGHNGDVGSTWETLWDEGGIYVYPTTAITLQISSGDTDDTSAGVGAQTVKIEGLDGDRRPLTEIISMNGQTQVPTLGKFFRVFRMKVITSGASSWNEGIVYAGTGGPTAGKPDVVYGLIEAFMGQSLMSLFTIPMDSDGHILQTHLLSSVAKATQAAIFVREIDETFQVKHFVPVYSGDANHIDQVAEKVPPGADIEIRAKASAGGGDVGGCFELAIIKI